MCCEVLCLFKAHVPLPVLATDTTSYQYVSFFPILARALQGEKKGYYLCILEAKKANRDRSTSLSRLLQEQEQCGSPRFSIVYTSPTRDPSSFISSHPGQKLLSWYQGGQIKTHSEGHPPLPCRYTYFKWPVQICQERCRWPGNITHLFHTMAPLGPPAQPAKLNKTSALIWIPNAAV